ncbi:F-box domain, Skp2-like protein [Akanthomyces lecanii RCEF 1005]|uniref:F-box domain, Skp2-like protein n=1 Tax=Akanthomyces lecanii RCEF 1005 TaxID=1081108 RepID=A0A168KBT0_CORDF|nr:F-box domain, Skp2-like protein [Akanthomyces lecanii RCEF 1005]
MDDDLYAADVPQLSPLSRLPHELLLYVARHLPLQDFCALRLTSQHISSKLRVLLAREDFVGVPWRDSAARLDALARLPECAQQIRRVRVRSRAVATARRLAAHPEEKRTAPLRADLLCDALCRLPKLEELELRWGRFPFMSRADLGLDVELGLDPTGEDDADSELARQLAYTTAGWQVEMLVDLAADAQPLRALTVAPLALDAMDQASYLPLVANLFNSLVRLDLQLTARAQRDDPSLLSKLEDVLEAAWVLRELRLDLDDGGLQRGCGLTEEEEEQRGEEHGSRELLPKTTISNLQSLTLVRAVTSLSDLAALLKRHAGTLRTLELRHVRGARPSSRKSPSGLATWEDVFRVVHDDLPKLTRATMRGHFEDFDKEIYFQVGEKEGEEEEQQQEEEEEYVRHGQGQNGEGSSSLQIRERVPVVDPEPLERYLVRLGKAPTLDWKSVAF